MGAISGNLQELGEHVTSTAVVRAMQIVVDGLWRSDAANPGGAGFQNVALDQGTRIDKLGGGHLNAARE